jgi:hypothetical protein
MNLKYTEEKCYVELRTGDLRNNPVPERRCDSTK